MEIEDLLTGIVTIVLLAIGAISRSLDKKRAQQGKTTPNMELPTFEIEEFSIETEPQEEAAIEEKSEKIEETKVEYQRVTSRNKANVGKSRSEVNAPNRTSTNERNGKNHDTSEKRTKRKFNLRDAVIYSEILNRKY